MPMLPGVASTGDVPPVEKHHFDELFGSVAKSVAGRVARPLAGFDGTTGKRLG
jgi:hypothetical protein